MSSNYKQKEELRSVGQRLMELREQHKMTQDELGAKLRVPRSTVAKWENGAQDFKSETIVRLCAILGVSADYLLLGVSAEAIDVYQKTGLVDSSLDALADLKNVEDMLLGGDFGRIGFINKLLSDKRFYEQVDEFVDFRTEWRAIQRGIVELEKIKKMTDDRDKYQDARDRLKELREHIEFLRWKHSQSVGKYIAKLLEEK